jgi:hypothetical protein
MTDADDIENAACKTIDQYLASVTYPVIQEQPESGQVRSPITIHRAAALSRNCSQPCMTG